MKTKVPLKTKSDGRVVDNTNMNRQVEEIYECTRKTFLKSRRDTKHISQIHEKIIHSLITKHPTLFCFANHIKFTA